jgi:hypothetical protein
MKEMAESLMSDVRWLRADMCPAEMKEIAEI